MNIKEKLKKQVVLVLKEEKQLLLPEFSTHGTNKLIINGSKDLKLVVDVALNKPFDSKKYIYCCETNQFIEKSKWVGQLVTDVVNNVKKELNVICGQKFTIDELKHLTAEKQKGQLNLVKNTPLFKSQRYSDDVYMDIIDQVEESCNENPDNYVYQFINDGLSFSNFISSLVGPQLNVVFNHMVLVYEVMKQKQIEGISLEDHVVEHGLDKNSFLPDGIVYDKASSFLSITYNGQTLSYKFKKLNLMVHELDTPGLDILYRYWLKQTAGTQQEIGKKSVHFKTINKHFFDNSSKYDKLISKVSNFYGMSVYEYEERLLTHNSSVYRQGGRLYIKNTYDGYHVTNTIFDHESTCSHVYTLDRERFKGLQYLDYRYSDVFLTWSQPEFQLMKSVLEGKIIKEVYLLFLELKFPERKMFCFFDIDENVSSEFFPTCEYVKIKEDYFYDKTGNDIFHESFFYAFENLTKKTKQSEMFRWEPNLTKKELFDLNKKQALDLLYEFKDGKVLSNKEIKFISCMFCYVNRKSFGIQNFRIRNVLEMINKDKDRSFVDVIIARFGDYGCLISCIYLFHKNAKLTLQGQQLLRSINWAYVKTEYWVDFYSKLSQMVKTEYMVNGYEMSIVEFKNLQYIEVFVGPLGYDGKTALESAAERSYKQVSKRYLNWSGTEEIGDNKTVVNRICRNICRAYWKQVFNKQNRVKFRGIKQTMLNRLDFSTTSSTAGLKSAFHDDRKLNVMFALDSKHKLEFMQSTKRDAMISESTDWFIRVLFDIPLTLCNMVLKPKELAKYRYIFSVFMPHYLWNSIMTYDYEDNLNKFGLRVKTDEIEYIKHNFRNKNDYRANIMNCVDYSVFNDQHEEDHKVMVFQTMFEVMTEKMSNKKNIMELKVCASWMMTACKNMILRFSADTSLYVKPKGRLMSGERSTSLINSVMSMFYYYLVLINMYGYYCYTNNDMDSDVYNDLIRAVTEDDYVPNMLMEDLLNNQIMGDDNLGLFDRLEKHHIYNDICAWTGLFLKPEKCLVGIGLGEFLRNVILKTKKPNIQHGYMNRALGSLVIGNLEGSEDRYLEAQFTQIYSQIHKVVLRSKHVGNMDKVFYEICKVISKINNTYKNVNNVAIKEEWFYMSKEQGGMGFKRFGDGAVFVNKTSFKTLPKDSRKPVLSVKQKSDALNEHILSKARALEPYGMIDGKGVESRYLQEVNNLLLSTSKYSTLYSSDWYDEYAQYVNDINEHIDGEYVVEELSGIKISQLGYTLFEQVNALAITKLGNVAQKIKKVTSLVQDYELIKSSFNVTQVISMKYGSEGVVLYELFIKNNIPNWAIDRIDDGLFKRIVAELYINGDFSLFDIDLFAKAVGYMLKRYFFNKY